MNKGKLCSFRKNTYFWLIFVVLTLAVYLSQVGTFLAYQSRVDILLIPKNERVASNIGFIKNNLEYLFEEKCERNGLSRKDVKVSSKKDNTVITFSTFSRDQQDLRKKNKQAVTDFFDLASEHYNVKKDIEMKIVGEIEVRSQPEKFWLLLLISALVGFVVSFVLFLIFEIVGGFSKKIQSSIKNRREVVLKEGSDVLKAEDVDGGEMKKDFEKVFEEKKEKEDQKDEIVDEVEELPKKASDENKKKDGISEIERIYTSYDQKENFAISSKSAAPTNLPTEKEEESKSEAVGAAPSNLPIGDNVVIIGDNDESKESVSDDKSGNTAPDEPTNEEYKKRLNQLLKGEM